ncbi:MAG TPA: hypothetical protein VHE35_04340 [Kofleriaceae bacterium]|nr:hypothetical protein [Kofleriaceae bacterium]
MALSLAIAALGACGTGGGDDPADDGAPADARPGDVDASPGGVDAGVPTSDAGVPPLCQTLTMTTQQACAASLTGKVTPCSVDGNGTPSATASLEVRKPDGTVGYLCANNWVDPGGFYFDHDRVHLVADASACCGGPAAPMLDWPAASPYFGVPHGPTRIKVEEMTSNGGGDLRENPFSIVVASAAAGASFAQARATWTAWAGDGQPHPAPDGSGSYWFPSPLPIDWMLVPTTTGVPLIVIAPEVTLDVGWTRPLGHPTMGACPEHGGAPIAYLGGTIFDDILTNRSGRFGHETTITAENLSNAAMLFNCYGIQIHSTEYVPPGN